MPTTNEKLEGLAKHFIDVLPTEVSEETQSEESTSKVTYVLEDVFADWRNIQFRPHIGAASALDTHL